MFVELSTITGSSLSIAADQIAPGELMAKGLSSRLAPQPSQMLAADRPNLRSNLTGRAGDDVLRGRAGSDTLRGLAGNDSLFGEAGDDRLYGGLGNDRLNGGPGRNQLYGEAGQDQLLGGRDAETLVGGSGDDLLNGKGSRDRITGGTGRDRFVLEIGAAQLNAAPEILDFRNGEDWLDLPGLKFADLSIRQGTGTLANSTILRNSQTGEVLALLRGIQSRSIDANDIWGAASLPVLPPTLAVQSNPVKFSASASEATIAATAAARIQLGTQTIYIGAEQVTSINQNPVLVSFDAQNPANNWRRTDYEITGVDGRGYGLFWSGSQLYALFTVDGTQGTPDQDFRRVSGGATQPWLQSYGAGGGAKITVLARLNPATGEMTDAVHLSARLSDGKSNSLTVNGLSTNPAGNLVVNAQSFFAPRRPDGQAMTQTSPGSSPFAYQLEITPDLKTVVSTAAAGWS
jgi:hypothetical protein